MPVTCIFPVLSGRFWEIAVVYSRQKVLKKSGRFRPIAAVIGSELNYCRVARDTLRGHRRYFLQLVLVTIPA